MFWKFFKKFLEEIRFEISDGKGDWNEPCRLFLVNFVEYHKKNNCVKFEEIYMLILP